MNIERNHSIVSISDMYIGRNHLAEIQSTCRRVHLVCGIIALIGICCMRAITQGQFICNRKTIQSTSGYRFPAVKIFALEILEEKGIIVGAQHSCLPHMNSLPPFGNKLSVSQ